MSWPNSCRCNDPIYCFIHWFGNRVAERIEELQKRPYALSPRLFNMRAAAELIDVSESVLRRAVANGKIPTVRFDRAIRFDRNDLVVYQKENAR